jgi:hypothetical protein
MVRCALVLALLADGTRAQADPAINLDRCATLDHALLHAAVDREIAVLPPANRVDDATLVVECSDGATAHISVVAHSSTLVLARDLDLGEVPADLRIKLVAVAVAELVETAAARGKERALAPWTEAAPPARAAVHARTMERPELAISKQVRRDDHAAARSIVIVPYGGVRAFASRPVPLAYTAFEVELHRLALGIAGSFGTTHDTLGALTPYLVTATASSSPACVGVSDRVCARLHGELGVAGVRASAASSVVVASNAVAPYAQLGLGSEFEHSLGSTFGVGFAIDAAVAKGLIAASQDRTPVRLDGLAITATVGLRWRP